ncbi:hypothetical protein C8J56DRAFT_894034 [Mycena floridula]|nr:hypothetical protein C8J56DRAFT_894034 [Mycena floridula]
MPRILNKRPRKMSLNDNEPTNIQWLEHLLEVVTLLQSASNLAPVPYVNAGLTLIVHILKTIKTARQNQDDFRELVTSIVGIVTLVRDEIVNPKLQTNSSAFMAHCKAFNESLLDIITEINNKLRSLSGAKKYLLSGAIKDDLQKHQDRIREIRYNFMLWIIMQNRLVVHEMRDTMHKMRKDIIELPRTLGIPGESILFIDILDLNTQLPLSLCQSWESFLELVLLIHKNLNRPGLRYITSGDFDLTINDQVVSSTIFSSLVKRGSTVKMSVMLHRSKEQSDADSRRCPICSTLHIEPVALGSEIQCVNCGATFRVSRGILDLEVLRQQDTSDIAAVSASLSPSSGHRETRFTMDDEEVQYLRRFHIVLPPRQLRPPGGP